MNKTVFWVGAEINKDAPTQLPDLKEVVCYMIEVIGNEQTASTFKDRITDYNSFIREIMYNAGEFLDPKILISQWNRIKGADINRGLECLKDAAFNANHCILAIFMKLGANIVTTNVDLCIEKAYNALEEKNPIQFVRSENGVYIYASQDEKSGSIYHLHGTCDNTSEIGGIYQIGAEVFSSEFRKVADKWMTEGYRLYFLGEDCNNNYDVILFHHYQNEHLRKKDCKISLVTTKHKREQSSKIVNLLTCFNDTKVIYMDSRDFIRKFYSLNTGMEEKEIVDLIHKMIEQGQVCSIDWKSKVKDTLYEERIFWDIMLLHVNQVTGISVAELDADIYRRIEQMPVMNRNMYTSLMLRYDYDLIPLYGYYVDIEQVQETQDSEVGEELIRLCLSPYNMHNKKILDLSYEVEQLQNEYLLTLRRKASTDKLESKAYRIKEDVESMLPSEKEGKLIGVPIQNCKDNAVLYQLHAGLRSISCSENAEVKKIEYDLFRSYCYYSQTGNRNGILKTLKCATFCNMVFYYKFGKKSFYDKAQKFKTLRRRHENSGN